MAVKTMFPDALGHSDWYPVRNDDADNEEDAVMSTTSASAALSLSDI